MDVYEPPFHDFLFDSFTVPVKRYEEYSAGRLISKGTSSLTIFVKKKDKISVTLVGNDLKDKIITEFEFDLFITLNDRLQLTINPKQTNVKDVLFSMLTQFIGHTRENKNFVNTEPIVGHVFTENRNIVKVSFKTTNPEKLIEFYTI